VAVDIINGAAVRSDRTPTKPSNVVVTPVSKVLPVKIPRELPHTGALLVGPALGGAVLLLGLGLVLLTASKRRRYGKHRG
jgi:LPXTG-motif cell wall-anchored protein